MSETDRPNALSTSMLWTGAVSLLISLGLNLGFAKQGAELFSNAWWAQWFPGYMCGISFLVIGLGLRRSARRRR